MRAPVLRTPKEVALATGRPERTIRNWAADLRIRSASNCRTRTLYVDLLDAQARSETTPRRNRQAA